MLLFPMTPPHEESSDLLDIDNGVPLNLGPNYDLATWSSDVATPQSMGMSSPNQRPNTTDGLAILADEDQDMSDGGAALIESDAEMNMLNTEAIEEDLILGLPHTANPNYNLPHLLPHPVWSASVGDVEDDDSLDEALDDALDEGIGLGYIEVALNPSNLLPAMSEVSQQLQQHIQGGQHPELEEAVDEGMVDFMTNSIAPPYLLPFPVHYQESVVSMAEVSPIINSPVVEQASQIAPHLWGTGSWATSSAQDIVVPPQNPQDGSHLSLVNPVANFAWDEETDADQNEVEDHSNLSLSEFLYSWVVTSHNDEPQKRRHGPSLTGLHKQREIDCLPPMRRSDLQGDKCDIQRISWTELGVTRLEARKERRKTYKNYTNLRVKTDWHPSMYSIENDQNFYRFRQMDFDHDIHLAHFQLRNIMSCASRDHIFYAGKAKIIQWNPTIGARGPKKVAMDLTDPVVQPLHAFSGGVQISTLTVAHDILVAGGFCGEYGLVNLRAHKDTKHTEGIVTDNPNSITNHLQVHLSRSSASPLVAFASNDNGMRILDVTTNKFIAEHKYDHAINCSAISPDQRLRVLVGDTCEVMICNSETGEVLQTLDGHRDYGFACDWADDGWTVATGNQDMKINIWDARKWTTPVKTVSTEMAGARSVKFSPLGSGKRVLVAAEPADFINIIDAENFSSKQTLSFFGEIGGFDFTNGGRDLLVANCDSMRGGLMEYERCDLAGGSRYEHEFQYNEFGEGQRSKGYDWMANDDDLIDHPRSRWTTEHRRRRAAGPSMAYF